MWKNTSKSQKPKTLLNRSILRSILKKQMKVKVGEMEKMRLSHEKKSGREERERERERERESHIRSTYYS